MRIIFLHILLLCALSGVSQFNVTHPIRLDSQTDRLSLRSGVYDSNNDSLILGIRKLFQTEDFSWEITNPLSTFSLGSPQNTGATLGIDVPNRTILFDLANTGNYEFSNGSFFLSVDNTLSGLNNRVAYDGTSLELFSENSFIELGSLGIQFQPSTQRLSLPAAGQALLSTGSQFFAEWGQYDYNDLLNPPDLFAAEDITGNEAAFDNFDKNENDDFSGNYTDLNFVGTAGLSDGVDSVLTEAQVDAFVANDNYLQAGANISQLNNDADFATTSYVDNNDDDTQLTEAEVDAFVANDNYLQAGANISQLNNDEGYIKTFEVAYFSDFNFNTNDILTMPPALPDLPSDTKFIEVYIQDRSSASRTALRIPPCGEQTYNANGSPSTNTAGGNLSNGDVSGDCYNRLDNRRIEFNASFSLPSVRLAEVKYQAQ